MTLIIKMKVIGLLFISLLGCKINENRSQHLFVYQVKNSSIDKLVFDLNSGVFGSGHRSSILRICSNDKFYCVENTVFNFSLPKSNLIPGSWSYNFVNYSAKSIGEDLYEK